MYERRRFGCPLGILRTAEGGKSGMNWLRFAIVAIATIVLALMFHYERTTLNGFSLFFGLLGVVLMASMVFRKSK
jgi:hypothetical protein